MSEQIPDMCTAEQTAFAMPHWETTEQNLEGTAHPPSRGDPHSTENDNALPLGI